MAVPDYCGQTLDRKPPTLTTVAAYNLLSTKWGTPIIESVFLPAHAQTSGDTTADTSDITETWTLDDDDGCNGPITFSADGTFTGSSDCYGDQSGTYFVSGNSVTLSLSEEPGTISADGNTIVFKVEENDFTTTLIR